MLLTNYFGKPQMLEGVGEVYPISVLEWETFRPLAERFLLISYDLLQKRFKVSKDVKLLDALIQMVLSCENESDRTFHFKQLEQLFSLTLHVPIKGYYDTKENQWLFLDSSQKVCLHRENYDAWRTIVMNQNLLYEPLIVEDERVQSDIDKAFLRMESKEESSIESILAYVSCFKGMKPTDLADYTYYQLRCDYEMCQRMDLSNASHLYLAQGGKGTVPSIASPLSIHENPFSIDKIFKKVSADRDGQLNNLMK